MSVKSHEKWIDEIASMKVSELNDLVEALQAKFNISAAMPMAAAASGAGAVLISGVFGCVGTGCCRGGTEVCLPGTNRAAFK